MRTVLGLVKIAFEEAILAIIVVHGLMVRKRRRNHNFGLVAVSR